MGSLRQTFDELVVHTRSRTSRWRLPWSFSTFDYRELCALLYEQADAAEIEFETATVTGRDGLTVHTDRGELRAPLVVDALGLAAGALQRDRDPAAERAPVARPGGPPRRRAARSWSCGSTTATCAPATRGASPRAMSCGSERARSGPRTTSRSRPSGSPASWACRPTVSGQLDPPPAAARGRGRRVLRRRLGRALSPAHRRGDSHGAVLRPRVRARAARGARRSHHARAGAGALRRVLATRTRANTAGCCACSARSGS